MGKELEFMNIIAIIYPYHVPSTEYTNLWSNSTKVTAACPVMYSVHCQLSTSTNYQLIFVGVFFSCTEGLGNVWISSTRGEKLEGSVLTDQHPSARCDHFSLVSIDSQPIYCINYINTFTFHSRKEDASTKESICKETMSSLEISPSSLFRTIN